MVFITRRSDSVTHRFVILFRIFCYHSIKEEDNFLLGPQTL